MVPVPRGSGACIFHDSRLAADVCHGSVQSRTTVRLGLTNKRTLVAVQSPIHLTCCDICSHGGKGSNVCRPRSRTWSPRFCHHPQSQYPLDAPSFFTHLTLSPSAKTLPRSNIDRFRDARSEAKRLNVMSPTSLVEPLSSTRKCLSRIFKSNRSTVPAGKAYFSGCSSEAVITEVRFRPFPVEGNVLHDDVHCLHAVSKNKQHCSKHLLSSPYCNDDPRRHLILCPVTSTVQAGVAKWEMTNTNARLPEPPRHSTIVLGMRTRLVSQGDCNPI